MNKLYKATVQTPGGGLEECAEFVITDTARPFLLQDILRPEEEYTFSGYVRSEGAGQVTVGGETFATAEEWTKCTATWTAEGADLPMRFTLAGRYYVYHAKLERGNKPTDWTPAPEDVEEAVGDVTDAADKLTERVTVNETDILQLSDRIEMKVSEKTYQQDMAGKVSQGQLAEVRQAMAALTADKATVEFVQGKTDDLNAALEAVQETLRTYFEFNAEGYMEVGKRGNAFTTRLDNEKLAFLQNGREVAYISNYEMLITIAKILTSMQLGGLKATVDSAGAVDWTWVGV